MLIEPRYGQHLTPVESTDITGSPNSPGGVNSSNVGYAVVLAATVGFGERTPRSSPGGDDLTDNNFNGIACRVWNGSKQNIDVPSNYGGNDN